MRQRDILFFWFPLFTSWLLMTAEGPIISAAINRLPDEVVMLAAMGIVLSLSVTIESPIINLLATSTALVRDRSSYLLVRKFTIHWIILLTLISFAIAFSPLFEVIVINWLNIPIEVAQWVQPGMKIMVFWSAAIGWRRFLQGIMIRYDQTRKVAWGTVVRLTTSAGVVVLLALWGQWPGVIIGAIGLMAGVLAEAAYATFAVQPLISNELSQVSPATPSSALTYRELFWFHLPLAGTSFLILLIQPMVTTSLARLDQPTLSLAAWPVLFQILLVARAPALALPEVVIARYQSSGDFAPLRRFSFLMAATITIAITLFVFLPSAQFYIFQIQDMTQPVGELALSALPLFILYPGIAVFISWLRGLLIRSRQTRYVNSGMAINLALTAVLLLVGVRLQWPGLPAAALALNVAVLAELIYLSLKTRTTLPFGLHLFGSTKAQLSQS